MNTETEIDAFVGRQIAAGLDFTKVDEAPWITAFEQRLPFRLPASYRSLVVRYRFCPFLLSGIEFFGNQGNGDDDDLVVASLRDPVLARVSLARGFVQIGRPDTGAYDPVCFDMNRRSNNREAPLVSLDHEAILIKERIHVLREYAKSFFQIILEGESARPA